jgi:RIO-like serine/threonine protein kinase
MESKKIAIAEAINENMTILSQTDYQTLKYVEGEISEADYAPIRELRRQCRADINRLEAEYKEMMGIA